MNKDQRTCPTLVEGSLEWSKSILSRASGCGCLGWCGRPNSTEYVWEVIILRRSCADLCGSGPGKIVRWNGGKSVLDRYELKSIRLLIIN